MIPFPPHLKILNNHLTNAAV
jgi:hypothetical protein